MRSVLILLCAVGGLVLAGCAGGDQTTTTPTGGATSPDTQTAASAPVRVDSAARQAGGCLFASGEGSCDVLKVHIDNTKGKRDFSANMFYWSAETADGQVFQTPDVDGPDAIAAGREGDVTLKFDVEGDGKLAKLRYEPIGESRIVADVPGY